MVVGQIVPQLRNLATTNFPIIIGIIYSVLWTGRPSDLHSFISHPKLITTVTHLTSHVTIFYYVDLFYHKEMLTRYYSPSIICFIDIEHTQIKSDACLVIVIAAKYQLRLADSSASTRSIFCDASAGQHKDRSCFSVLFCEAPVTDITFELIPLFVLLLFVCTSFKILSSVSTDWASYPLRCD